MSEGEINLLSYVLIEKYKSALNHLLIESFLFRFSLFLNLFLVVIIPIKFSPISIAIPGFLLSLFWMIRAGFYAKEVETFDDRIIDYEGKRIDKEKDNKLVSLYIYWRRDLSERSSPLQVITNYEPWVWFITSLIVAFIRSCGLTF